MTCKYPGCRNKIVQKSKESSWYGYCFRHGQKMGKVSAEETAAFEEKRGKGVSEAWKRGRGVRPVSKKEFKKMKEAADQAALPKEVLKAKESQEAQDIIHMLLGDQGYDAGKFMDEMAAANGEDARKDAKVQKLIFTQWFVADPKSREPKDFYSLCKLLGITMVEGREWMESDWFINDLHGSVNKMMKLTLPYLARMGLAKVIVGDFNAWKELMKMVGKYTPSEGTEDFSNAFDPDILGEAASIVEDQEN